MAKRIRTLEQKVAEQRRERARIEKGICIRCTRKAEPGKVRCAIHARRIAAKMEQHRQACKEAGICPTCRLPPGNPATTKALGDALCVLRHVRHLVAHATEHGHPDDRDEMNDYLAEIDRLLS